MRTLVQKYSVAPFAHFATKTIVYVGKVLYSSRETLYNRRMDSPGTIGPSCRAKIEALRLGHGSLRAAASIIGVSYGTLDALLRGRRGVGMKTARRLQAGLSLRSVDQVFK